MSKIISAGFAVLSKDNRILLGKTSKYNVNGSWTIFKGQQEEGEVLIETAIRELREESGIDVISDNRLNENTSSSPFFSFGINDKTVFVYLLQDKEGVLDNYKFKCSSYFGDSNPEISDYSWFSIEEALNKVYPSQRGLIEKLIPIVKKNRGN